VTALSPRPPRPSPTTPRDYHFPRFERRTLGNGLRVVVAPVPKLPLVTITALVDAGAVCDPGGKEGIAQLTARLWTEGTVASEGADLALRFERLGASVESYADWDVAALTMTAMSRHLDAAFALVAEVLLEPAFRERDVERLKGERLAELLQLRAEPRGLADETFARAVYDPASRFSRPDGGTTASVASLTRDDVVNFASGRRAPASTTIVIVGDVTVDAAVGLVERTLGQWQGAAPPRGSTVATAARRSRGVLVVDKPDAPQSEIRIGHVGVPRSTPDYFPLVVMNAILGGLFNSRINMNLREEHAYTYGASSAFDWRRQAGPFVARTAVRSDVTDAAVREVLLEVDRMRDTPVTADELSLATNYLDGVFPIRYETTAAIAAALSALTIQELPDDYFDRYRLNVRAVTTADVARAAQVHLDPARFQVVIVGDATSVGAPLEALGIGPVEIETPAS
jgi:zinc protease